MSDVNPYAPPTADEGAPAAPRKRKRKGKKDLEAALAALDEHLSRPENVARDRKAAGGKLRTVTLVLLGLGVLGIVFGALAPGDSRKVGAIIGFAFGGILLVIGIIAALVDLTLQDRGSPGTPLGTLKSHVKSIALGRYGYTWATLSPTARAQSVNAPDLGPVAGGLGSFSMDTEAGFKAYAMTFARPAGGQMRGMQLKDPTVVSEDGDVAVVQATMHFQSWPQWANIMLGMGGVFAARVGQKQMAPLALIGIAAAVVGLIGLLALRKKHQVAVKRTLLRGRNGAWYLLDADVLEGARASDD
jgi:hypothetical protein